MAKAFVEAVSLVIVLFLFATMGQSEQIGERKWDFEASSVDQAPAGFSFGRTGSGQVGRWLIKAEKDAPSGGHVLAQLDTDSTSYRFPIAVAEELLPRDFRLSVRQAGIGKGRPNLWRGLPLYR